mmetsp:Transcript_6451/g.10817  ORF Transcript_6451/g.10817 Transcript_6451/m.10817 type:complete len:301 (+) Transcript_6451:562-1464(+)
MPDAVHDGLHGRRRRQAHVQLLLDELHLRLRLLRTPIRSFDWHVRAARGVPLGQHPHAGLPLPRAVQGPRHHPAEQGRARRVRGGARDGGGGQAGGGGARASVPHVRHRQAAALEALQQAQALRPGLRPPLPVRGQHDRRRELPLLHDLHVLRLLRCHRHGSRGAPVRAVEAVPRARLRGPRRHGAGHHHGRDDEHNALGPCGAEPDDQRVHEQALPLPAQREGRVRERVQLWRVRQRVRLLGPRGPLGRRPVPVFEDVCGDAAHQVWRPQGDEGGRGVQGCRGAARGRRHHRRRHGRRG